LREIEEYLQKFLTEKNKINLVNFLDALPPEETREYEVFLTKLVQQEKDIAPLLNSVFEKCIRKLGEDEKAEHIAFACFVALNIYYRRNKDITKVHDLITQNEKHFHKHPMFAHMYSLFLRSTGRKKDQERALEYARKAARAMPEQAGVQHSLAEVLINLIEEGLFNRSSEDREKYLSEAEEAIEKALNLDSSYPKFYSTKGRLYALKGNYDEAREYVELAIDKEDSNASDYTIRLNNYNATLAKIQLMEFYDNIDNKFKESVEKINRNRQETEEQLKQFRVQNLEFLGLFAAIISFTVGGIQFIANQSFDQGVLLLSVFTGCLLCIYGGLSIILHGKDHIQRTVVVVLIAMVLIVGPLLVKGIV